MKQKKCMQTAYYEKRNPRTSKSTHEFVINVILFCPYLIWTNLKIFKSTRQSQYEFEKDFENRSIDPNYKSKCAYMCIVAGKQGRICSVRSVNYNQP